MRPWTISSLIGALLSTSVLVQTAAAHPHMFFASTAQFLFDKKGRLEKIRTVFLVDELNTLYTFTELKVNADGDQTLTSDERNKIAETVLDGFARYNYFAKLANERGPISLGKPLEVTVHLTNGRLGLSFVMPLAQPQQVDSNTISLQLYDPTYFTAISIDRTPMIVGNASNCKVTVNKPSETEESRRSQQLLSELSREETPEEEDIGFVFAETTMLQCQG